MGFAYVRFNQVDLSDSFFNTLKADYTEFETWFAKKADNMAYVSINESNKLDGFLYLKPEKEALLDIDPPMPAKLRLKVGTFKIDAHGTRLGDRFVKKLFDHAMSEGVEEVYVTVFAKHDSLIKLLTRHGFQQAGSKTTQNGVELVLSRSMAWTGEGLLDNYPLVRMGGARKALLSIFPIWHTRLLPDSKLITEGPDVVKDISHTNSIQKIYLAGLSGAETLKSGDLIIIYRTSDNQGAAYYRSVATSVCVVESVRMIQSFQDEKSFLDYCLRFSVFDESELRSFYKTRKYPVVIRFTYNISFPKRVNRRALLESVGLDHKQRWAFLPLTDAQFLAILREGRVDENFVVH